MNQISDAMAQRIAMIVDDEWSVRMYIKAVLESDGFHTIEAENGVEALEQIRQLGTGVHLLVSDIKMPQMNGIELACLVRADFPTIPIILISGYPDEFSDVAFEFISKPFRVETLLSTVRNVMARTQE
jgi:CheY-like chemotaxis protein